jgi:hypothetical protein
LGHTNARDVNLPRDHNTTRAESTSNGRRQGDRATARRNAAMKRQGQNRRSARH